MGTLACVSALWAAVGWQWRYVHVDDRIPCDKKDRPIYAHGQDPNEVWVMLVEKAYAKLHMCYENLKTGFIDYGLKDLTGGTCIKLKWTDKSTAVRFGRGQLVVVLAALQSQQVCVCALAAAVVLTPMLLCPLSAAAACQDRGAVHATGRVPEGGLPRRLLVQRWRERHRVRPRVWHPGCTCQGDGDCERPCRDVAVLSVWGVLGCWFVCLWPRLR